MGIAPRERQPTAKMKAFAARLFAVFAVVWCTLSPSVRAQNTGTLTTLYSFSPIGNYGPNSDGAYPSPLVQGSDGNFYGTTADGGSAAHGTVFSITPAGVLTTLHIFSGGDGANPFSALVAGSDGNFYGTTADGGSNDEGTIFSITPADVLTTLHSFSATDGNHLNSDGVSPGAALVQGRDGNFYGTTGGGGSGGHGTVFSITPTGMFTTLHSFGAVSDFVDNSDGTEPFSALVEGGDGNFYGTTESRAATAVMATAPSFQDHAGWRVDQSCTTRPSRDGSRRPLNHTPVWSRASTAPIYGRDHRRRHQRRPGHRLFKITTGRRAHHPAQLYRPRGTDGAVPYARLVSWAATSTSTARPAVAAAAAPAAIRHDLFGSASAGVCIPLLYSFSSGRQ